MAKKQGSGEPKAKRERKPKATTTESVVEVQEAVVNEATEATIQEPAVEPEVNAQDGNIPSQEVPVETITFTLVAAEKSGTGKYRAEGYRGTIYINKSLMSGELPATVEVIAEGFAPKGQPKAPKIVDPEKAAKKAAREAKRAEQAEKLRARLAKLEEKLAKTAAKTAPAAEPVAEPTEM